MKKSKSHSETTRENAKGTEKAKIKWKRLGIPLNLVGEGLVSVEVLDSKDYTIHDLNDIQCIEEEDDASFPPAESFANDLEDTIVEEDNLNNPQETKRNKRKRRSLEEDCISVDKDVHSDPDVEDCDSLNEFPDEEVVENTKEWSRLLKSASDIPIVILKNLYRNGMLTPTKIQSLTLKPSLIDNKNIIACAETGSGKTLSFVLPVVLSLMINKAENTIECLVLLPTRELALQVRNVFKSMMKETNLHVVGVIGGISVQKQSKALKRNPSVIVATPGRLWDVLNSEEHQVKLNFRLKFLILDEADRFIEDKSFNELDKIVKLLQRGEMQKFICSATIMDMKGSLNPLFKIIKMKDPLVCIASNENELSIPFNDLDEGSYVTLPETLTFKIIKSFDNDKELKLIAFLIQYLSEVESTHCIVFVNSISYVYRLESILWIFAYSSYSTEIHHHFSLTLWKDKHELGVAKSECVTTNKPSIVDYITGLHSKLKQKQRLKRLEQFAKFNKSVIICTDVAARGIDLPNVNCVVHFHPPRTSTIFIHRSGRTARYHSEGQSVCLCACKEMDLWKKLFSGINRNLNEMEIILDCIPAKLYQKYKLLLKLANNIELEEYKMSKKKKTDNWLERASKGTDIELSDEEEAEKVVGKKKIFKKLKSGKIELLRLRSDVGIN